MAKHIARITLTRAGGFPQEIELGEGTTVTIGDGVATVKKITADSVALSYARGEGAPLDITLSGEKPHTLSAGKTPIAALALTGIAAQE